MLVTRPPNSHIIHKMWVCKKFSNSVEICTSTYLKGGRSLRCASPKYNIEFILIVYAISIEDMFVNKVFRKLVRKKVTIVAYDNKTRYRLNAKSSLSKHYDRPLLAANEPRFKSVPAR